MIGTNLRFFSNKVFGVPVDAHVTRFNPKTKIITLQAFYFGHEWKAQRHIDTIFFHPHNHKQGHAFSFNPNIQVYN